MKKIIFFDLDDTLYRRSSPFRDAAAHFFRERETEISSSLLDEAFLTTQRRCEDVFTATQKGELSREEGYIYRYTKGFEDVGIRLTREEAFLFGDAYRQAQKHIRLDPVAEEVLNSCRKRYRRIGLITNGQGQHQREKIRTLGLEKWLDAELTVISGEIGTDKPDPGIFEYARKLTGCLPQELVYVGDSAETDVGPARAAGWNGVLWDWKDTEKTGKEILALSEEGSEIQEQDASGSQQKSGNLEKSQFFFQENSSQ